MNTSGVCCSRLALVSMLAVGVLALSPGVARAQSAPPPADPPPPAREGSAELAYISTTGNASTQTFSVGGELIVRPTQWVVRNKFGFLRNESSGAVTAKSLEYRARAERVLSPRASAFGEYNYFQDEFAGVSHRNALVAGVAYKVVDFASQKLSVDGGLGYLNEQRTSGPDVSSGTVNFGGAYRWKFSPTAELTDDARFDETFADAADWRVAQTLAVTARLTGLLSLKVSNAVRFTNRPVPGFKKTDTNTSVALVAKF